MTAICNGNINTPCIGRLIFHTEFYVQALAGLPGKIMERAVFNIVFPQIKDQIHHLQHGFV